MDERRTTPRVPQPEHVWVGIGGNQSARLVDISPAGAHLELSTALNPNQLCRVALDLDGETIRVKARVVHCKLTGYQSFGSGGQLVYRAGVRFTDVDSDLKDAIRRAYPVPVERQKVRRGPIKVKVDTKALEKRARAEGQSDD